MRWVLLVILLTVGCAEAPLRQSPRPPIFELPPGFFWGRNDGSPGTKRRLQQDLVYCRMFDERIAPSLTKTEEGGRAADEAWRVRMNCMLEHGWVFLGIR